MNQHNETTELAPAKVRLREAPSARFSGPQHVFDLLELSAHLKNETNPGADGHRQITVFHQGATTMVLFCFEAGGKLADHTVSGLVTIHVLDGALTVVAEGESGLQTHKLIAGQILVLSPGVVHNASASQAGRMLLTVHLEQHVAPTSEKMVG